MGISFVIEYFFILYLFIVLFILKRYIDGNIILNTSFIFSFIIAIVNTYAVFIVEFDVLAFCVGLAVFTLLSVFSYFEINKIASMITIRDYLEDTLPTKLLELHKDLSSLVIDSASDVNDSEVFDTFIEVKRGISNKLLRLSKNISVDFDDNSIMLLYTLDKCTEYISNLKESLTGDDIETIETDFIKFTLILKYLDDLLISYKS